MEEGFELARLRIGTPQFLPERFVIAEVEKGEAVGFHSVAQRDGRVVEELHGDANAI